MLLAVSYRHVLVLEGEVVKLDLVRIQIVCSLIPVDHDAAATAVLKASPKQDHAKAQQHHIASRISVLFTAPARPSEHLKPHDQAGISFSA